MSRDPDLVWRALAHPVRRDILDLLAVEPTTTGKICAHFARPDHGEIGRTGVMKHLDVLQKAGLVLIRREGRHRWNHLNPVPIQEVCDRWVSRHVRDLASSANRLKGLVEGQRTAPATAPPSSSERSDDPA